MSVPAAARDEMDTLLDALLKFARMMLDRRGEFYPCGASIDSHGGLSFAAGWDGNEQADSNDILKLVYDDLRARAARHEIRASAVCVGVRVQRTRDSEKSDAVQVAIEHAAADPVKVFLPYTKRRIGGIKYGELFAEVGERNVFD
jgi:hypothetical protein